jgi:hypothetical protein
MLTILTLIGCMTVLVMLLFVIVVIGIHQEPATEELSKQAPSLIAASARRLLGLYVRKPHSPPHGDRAVQDGGAAAPARAGRASST